MKWFLAYIHLRKDKISDQFVETIQKSEMFIGQYKGEDSVKEIG